MTIALGAAVLVPATAFATAAGAGDSAAGAALVSSRRIELRDLYFGEALYEAYQRRSSASTPS